AAPLGLGPYVRRTEELFTRHPARALLFSKFVPGLSLVTPPLAGAAGVGPGRFACQSAAGALLWSGTWVGVGVAAAGTLEGVVAAATPLATFVVVAALAIVAAACHVWRWAGRHRHAARSGTPRICERRLDTLTATR